mgnify:CR=1 FL=1
MKSIQLLEQGGTLTYIIPNTLLRATVYDGIRKDLLENCQILNIVDLSSGRFAEVTASTIIFIAEKSKPKQNHEVEIIDNFDSIEELTPRFIKQGSFLKNISYTFNIFSTGETDKIIEKVNLHSEKLGKNFAILAGGIATGPDKKKYIANRPLNSQYKPLIEGKDIGKYHINFRDRYILYDKNKLYRAREERLFLDRLNELVVVCTKGFEEYEYSRAKNEVERFFWSMFCDNYLEILKDRLYNPKIRGTASTRKSSTRKRPIPQSAKLAAKIVP